MGYYFTSMTYKDISTILRNLSSEMQSQFVKEIFNGGNLTTEFTNKMGEELGQKVVNHFRNNFLVEIIRHLGTSAEKTLFENLKLEQPVLAEKIRQNLFVVEDIVLMTPESIQKIISESNMMQFIYSICGMPEELSEQVFDKLPDRLSERLKEEKDKLPQPSKDKIHEAQVEIVEIMSNLREQGELTTE